MCFAPQRRALFRHLNFQKWSDNGVFCTFWLGNVLRATTACTFSTSQLPKVVRQWCVLYILTWKCASRHNGVQFFISHLASWLCTRRFSEPTFRPSGALSSYSFSSTLLSSNLPLLSASSLLCFSSVHIVGSLTSKLPSTRWFKDIDNIIAELLAARRVPKMTLAPLEKAAPRPSTRAQRKAQKGPGLAAGWQEWVEYSITVAIFVPRKLGYFPYISVACQTNARGAFRQCESGSWVLSVWVVFAGVLLLLMVFQSTKIIPDMNTTGAKVETKRADAFFYPAQPTFYLQLLSQTSIDGRIAALHA